MSVKPGSAWWILGMGAISTYGEEPKYPSPDSIALSSITATATDTTATLWWLPPPPSSGSVQTDHYLIQMIDNGTVIDSVETADTNYTWEGLEVDTEYCFRVYSVSSFGTLSDPTPNDPNGICVTTQVLALNLIHIDKGKFQIDGYSPTGYFEVLKKSDGSFVTNPDSNGLITISSFDEFVFNYRTAAAGPIRSSQNFGTKAWAYESYKFGDNRCQCNNNNPCQCCNCGKDCSDGTGWDDWGCFNCCGETCGQCTGERAKTYSAPWEYGPGSNTYPYSGGEWFYIGEVVLI